jgi:hypothetical protein
MKRGAHFTQKLITDFAFVLRYIQPEDSKARYQVRLIHADKPRRGQPRVITELYDLQTLVKLNTVKFLRAKNSEGYHVYAAPDATQFILVDDLDKDKLAAMHKDGLCTRFVVMSSPGNFQAWLQVAEEPITPEEQHVCAKLLARRYGGDMGATASMQLGRLPGLTNRKPDYLDENGRYPFAGINQPAMRAVPRNVINTEVLIETREVLASSSTPEGTRGLQPGTNDQLSDLPNDEAAALYHGTKDWLIGKFGMDAFTKPDGSIDRSGLDDAIVKHLALGGMDHTDIIAVLMAGSDKAKERGIEYVYQTIQSAFL